MNAKKYEQQNKQVPRKVWATVMSSYVCVVCFLFLGDIVGVFTRLHDMEAEVGGGDVNAVG